MLEVWMELHQPRFCTGLPLNKSAEKENKCYNIPLKFTPLNYCKMSSTNHDKSSKMGLLLVLKTAMIAGRSAASGSPGGVEKNVWLKPGKKLWLCSSRGEKKWIRPLRSTANRSPVGSQARDWISPPTLVKRCVLLYVFSSAPLPVAIFQPVNHFNDSSYTTSPSAVLKVVSDRSATTAAACDPFEVLVGGPGEQQSQHAGNQLVASASKDVEKMHVTWRFTEGERVDDHFSLNREEQSASIWTPTARLQEDDIYWDWLLHIFLLSWAKTDSEKTSPGSDLSSKANVHKSTSWSPKPWVWVINNVFMSSTFILQTLANLQMNSLMSDLNRADGVEARTWLPSGDQDRKLTPPPPTRWSGTQLSEATSQTWNTQTLSEGGLIMRRSHRSHISCIVAKKAGLLLGYHHCRVHRRGRQKQRSAGGPGDGGDRGVARVRQNLSTARRRPAGPEEDMELHHHQTGHEKTAWDPHILLFICNWRGEYLVEREQGSTCHTSTQFWQATARAEAHSGFHCTAATFLWRRCFNVGVVALRGKRKRRIEAIEESWWEIWN